MRAFRRAWKQRAVSRSMVAIAVIATSCIGKGRPTVSKRQRLVWPGWSLAILWWLVGQGISPFPSAMAGECSILIDKSCSGYIIIDVPDIALLCWIGSRSKPQPECLKLIQNQRRSGSWLLKHSESRIDKHVPR